VAAMYGASSGNASALRLAGGGVSFMRFSGEEAVPTIAAAARGTQPATRRNLRRKKLF
jgi:hypothetical protein